MLIVLFLALLNHNLLAKRVKREKGNLRANQVSMSFESIGDKKVLKVIKDSIIKAVDEPTFVRVKDIDFQDGIIEVSMLGRLLKIA